MYLFKKEVSQTLLSYFVPAKRTLQLLERNELGIE